MEGSSSSAALPDHVLSALGRLVFELKMNHIMAMGVVSFWMWLESVGHPAFIRRTAAMPIETILSMTVEAETCLSALFIDVSNPLSASAKRDARALAMETPRLIVDLRYLYFFWEVAYGGVCSILDELYRFFFGEHFSVTSNRRVPHDPPAFQDRMIDCTDREGILGSYQNRRGSLSAERLMNPVSRDALVELHRSPRPEVFGQRGSFDLEYESLPGLHDAAVKNYRQLVLDEGIQTTRQQAVTFLGGGRNERSRTSALDSGLRSALSSSSPRSSMNQRSDSNSIASAWTPSGRFVPRDERTLFVTFSNGYPLSESDLFQFFNGTYGGVELIYVQQAEGQAYPLFARIVFVLQEICAIVMDGKEKMKFMIKGRHVWVRHYVPKKKQRLQWGNKST